jgi:hypothetical protein
MLCILGDMGWLTIGNWWYQLGPGVGTRKVDGNGECIGWSGVWVDGVDGVGNGTLAGSTCIGDGGCMAGAGAGAGACYSLFRSIILSLLIWTYPQHVSNYSPYYLYYWTVLTTRVFPRSTC